MGVVLGRRKAGVLAALVLIGTGLVGALSRYRRPSSSGTAPSPPSTTAATVARDVALSKPPPSERSAPTTLEDPTVESFLEAFWGADWEKERSRYVAAGIDLARGMAKPIAPWREVRSSLEAQAREFFDRGLGTQERVATAGLVDLLGPPEAAEAFLAKLFPRLDEERRKELAREAPIQLADPLYELSLASNAYLAEVQNAFDALLEGDGMRRSPLIPPAPGEEAQVRVHVEGSGWFAVAELRDADRPRLRELREEASARATAALRALRAMARARVR